MLDEKITATEARQATMRPRAMVLVLFASLFLCLMAGLGLALGWFSLPSLPQQRADPNVPPRFFAPALAAILRWVAPL